MMTIALRHQWVSEGSISQCSKRTERSLLENLPPEIAPEIAKHLDAIDVCELGKCSKSLLAKYLNSGTVFFSLLQRDFPMEWRRFYGSTSYTFEKYAPDWVELIYGKEFRPYVQAGFAAANRSSRLNMPVERAKHIYKKYSMASKTMNHINFNYYPLRPEVTAPPKPSKWNTALVTVEVACTCTIWSFFATMYVPLWMVYMVIVRTGRLLGAPQLLEQQDGQLRFRLPSYVSKSLCMGAQTVEKCAYVAMAMCMLPFWAGPKLVNAYVAGQQMEKEERPERPALDEQDYY